MSELIATINSLIGIWEFIKAWWWLILIGVVFVWVLLQMLAKAFVQMMLQLLLAIASLPFRLMIRKPIIFMVLVAVVILLVVLL